MARPLIPFVQNGYYASRNWIPLVKGNGFTTSGGGEQEEVWETASGSIVTFDAVAAPLRQLSVSVEPVQNLNGYDNPWPAGGGKNKADFPVSTSLPYSERLTTVFDAGEDITVSNLVLSFFLENASFSNGQGAICDFKKNDGTHQYRVGGVYGISEGQTYTGQYSHAESNITFRYLNVMLGADYIHFTSGKASVQLEMDTSTATPFAPYSNICPISGRTGLNVYRTGVNVWDEEVEDGYITTNGGLAPYTNAIRSKNYSSCKPSTSYCHVHKQGMNGCTVAWYDSNKTFIERVGVDSSDAVVITSPSNAYYFKLSFYNYKVQDAESYAHDVSFNYPSSDHEYHAYTGRTVPITFPDSAGTVYGGSLVLNQDGTADITARLAGVDMGTLSWSLSNGNFYAYMPTNAKAPVANGQDALCENYPVYVGNYNTFITLDKLMQVCNSSFSARNKFVLVRDSAFSDAATFKSAMNGVKLVYELATPFEIPLTPEQISTLQGTNNVWSDAGNVTVEYRAQ